MKPITFSKQRIDLVLTIDNLQTPTQIIMAGVGSFTVPESVMQLAYDVPGFEKMPLDNQARIVVEQMLRVAESIER